VTLSQGVGEGRPFAALRSMYVTETNNDVARLAWRGTGEAFEELPVMRAQEARAAEIWAGRHIPSRHNTSAPDHVLRGFSSRP
jgi:hypothetical protein